MSEYDMAKRIRDLRTSQNLTLEQVANEVGVGKSTVRKWETGMIANMKRDKISSLAKALHTTPAYLMGWVDESSQKEIDENLVSAGRNEVSNNEYNFITLYRLLPPEAQEDIYYQVQSYLERRGLLPK